MRDEINHFIYRKRNLLRYRVHKYIYCNLGKHTKQVGIEGTKSAHHCYYCNREVF